MFDQLFSFPAVRARHRNAPLADDRIRFLGHLAELGLSRRTLLAYLREMYRHLRRPLIVVVDRLNVHQAAVRQLRQTGAAWLHVEWLPPYAPDLNPVEAI